MKTRGFKTVKFLASIFSISTIMASLALIVYLARHFRFLQIEIDVMEEFNLTLCNILKMLMFLNPGVCLLSSYALNIPSKFVMLIATYISSIILFGSLYILYYLRWEYSNFFGSILDNEFYSRPGLIVAIQNWKPDVSAADLKRLCKETMVSMTGVVFYYELFSFLSIFALVLLLSLARSIKIEQEGAVEPPLISELSKVGLNTSSLRTKRVVSTAA